MSDTSCPANVGLPTLGVTIVNYNTEQLTLNCVASLLAQGIAAPEHICVVDNESPDGSGARLATSLPAGVRLIHSGRNGGFGAGVNIGVAALDTPLVLVLNPDTYFLHNKVHVIRELFAKTSDLGVVGLKLVNPDGSLQYSARRFYSLLDILARRSPLGVFPPMRRLAGSHLLKRNWNGPPFQADWVMGTGFVVRRSAFDAVGRMDEGYFLYFEEVDLCARMWVEGWQVMGVPEVELVHEHQRHSQAGIWSKSGQTHIKSMFRFFTKFGVPWVNRPQRSRMKAAYLQWRRRVLGGSHGVRTDQP